MNIHDLQKPKVQLCGTDNKKIILYHNIYTHLFNIQFFYN